jgi:hypothetical protein
MLFNIYCNAFQDSHFSPYERTSIVKSLPYTVARVPPICSSKWVAYNYKYRSPQNKTIDNDNVKHHLKCSRTVSQEFNVPRLRFELMCEPVFLI